MRLVTVDLRWWDTHVKGFESLRLGFLPRSDQAYSALIEDLEQRGLLDSTLVIAWGEFGRTPRVNNDAGRDHYPERVQRRPGRRPDQGRPGGRRVRRQGRVSRRPIPRRRKTCWPRCISHLGVDTEAAIPRSNRPADRRAAGGKPIDELC